MNISLLIAAAFATGVGFTALSLSPDKNMGTTIVKPDNNPDDENRVQVALLLDCSGSMDGLIEQAKSQLWKMVNALATTKRNGKAPKIEIALYEYGKTNLPAEKGYIAQLSPFTADLDKISELLFAMRTNGGDEYCGHVIRTTLDELAWTNDNNDLKVIIIAGNEPFNQGNVDFRAACRDAIKKGIIVNTIHCGDCEQGVREYWKEGAELADGQYLCINTNATVVHIPTPYDQQILDLNTRLNDTYIGYGDKGEEMKIRQEAQDANAVQYGAANMATRAATKANAAAYSNDDWDVVDAAKKDKDFAKKMAEAPKSAPSQFKGLNKEQIEEKIVKMSKEREDIQSQIKDLSAKAESFRQEEMKKQATNGNENTLDAVMIKTMVKQASQKGFETGK